MHPQSSAVRVSPLCFLSNRPTLRPSTKCTPSSLHPWSPCSPLLLDPLPRPQCRPHSQAQPHLGHRIILGNPSSNASLPKNKPPDPRALLLTRSEARTLAQHTASLHECSFSKLPLFSWILKVCINSSLYPVCVGYLRFDQAHHQSYNSISFPGIPLQRKLSVYCMSFDFIDVILGSEETTNPCSIRNNFAFAIASCFIRVNRFVRTAHLCAFIVSYFCRFTRIFADLSQVFTFLLYNPICANPSTHDRDETFMLVQ